LVGIGWRNLLVPPRPIPKDIWISLGRDDLIYTTATASTNHNDKLTKTYQRGLVTRTPSFGREGSNKKKRAWIYTGGQVHSGGMWASWQKIRISGDGWVFPKKYQFTINASFTENLQCSGILLGRNRQTVKNNARTR
jgi:hypothetical protein